MITTTPTTAPALVHRDVFDLDWRRLARFGGLLALGQVFIALSNMPVGLDSRVLVDPVLSLGYFSLLWLPLMLGYAVGSETVLEGMAATARGPRDVIAGAVTGVIGGAGLGALVLMLDRFDLRDPLVNWSPQLLELLTFDRGLAFGVAIWILICANLGAAGGLYHLLAPALRHLAVVVILSVLGVSIFESVIVDLELGLDFMTDALYAKKGGTTLEGVALVVVVAAAASFFGRGQVAAARTKVRELEGPQAKSTKIALSVVGLAVLLVLPQFLGTITNELLANVGLFVLLALGLNIVVGLAGILDLGYVAFFAVGGYTTAVLTSPNSPGYSPELPWFVAMLVVVVLAALVGLFIGAPVIRMRGDYLAIVTLGFGEIIRLLFLSDWLKGFFGGAQGITRIPGVQVFGLATVKGTDPKAVFYLVLVFCALAIYVSWRLENSRIGRAWMAIREDESVAEAMGVNTVNTKLLAFVVGAVLASFSGAIFAAKVGSIFPNSFLILVSIVILVVVIVGGIGNIPGVIVGAVVLIGVLGGPRQPGLLQEFQEFKLLIYGALLIWMMLKRPEGLVPSVRRTRELHEEEFLQDAWLKGEIDTGDDAGEVAPA